MAKFWSRALFYKEWKNAFWMSALLTGVLIRNPVYAIMSKLNRLKLDVERGIFIQQQLGDWFGGMLIRGNGWLFGCLFITTILVVSLFSHERQGTTGNLLASMPFSRQQTIGTKWLTGALAIIIPFGVVFLLLTGFYWANISWIDTAYGLVPQWALLSCLFLLTFYTFLFFVQTVMGQNVVAGIVGAICTLIPWFLFISIPSIIKELFNLSYNNSVLRVIGDLGQYTVWTRLIEGGIEDLPPNWENYYYFYTNYGLRIGLMVLIIIGFYTLSQLAFAKNPMEKNGQLLMFRFLEPVLIWGFAICFGLLISGIFGLGYGSSNFAVSLYLALGTTIGYWVAKKTVAYYQR